MGICCRCGPRRKAGRRYPSGRLVSSKVRDRGTPELRARRRKPVGDPNDARAASLLGIIAARGVIEPAEYEPGEGYAGLHFGAARFQMGFVPAHPGAAALPQSEVVLRPGFLRTIVGTLSIPIAFEEARRSVAQQSGARAGAAIVDDVAIFPSRARTTGARVELAWWPRRPQARFRGTGSAESTRYASGGAE